MKKLLRTFVLLVSFPIFAQQGGMWVPSLLKGMNEKEMKSLGMKMSVTDIYDVNNSSLKDAVPQFNGGCTAEVISPKGLLLTNHHCGYGEIQSHSTVDHDYLQDGFWAKSYEEELPNPDLEVTFIVSIHDVTKEIMNGVDAINSEAEKKAAVQKNMNDLQKSFKREAWQNVMIRTFFEGNQYMLFVTESYEDVRLVGAPPSSIGKFGSDTDNWVWPRHTGDFSLFRIYADKNNRPAKYSKDNVPYTSKHYFPVSIQGVEPNDFTLVYGYPGRTQEYLPSFAVEQIVNDLNPAKIEIRDKALKVADGFMRQDQAIKIQYASKYAGIANYWKKWIGESQGLKKSNAVAIKKAFEQEFLKRAKQQNKMNEYGDLLPQFERIYNEITPYTLARDYFMEVVLRNNELLSVGFRLYQLENAYTKVGEQGFNDRKENLLKGLASLYKDYNKDVDQGIFNEVVKLYGTKAPANLTPDAIKNKNYTALGNDIYSNSALTSYDGLKKLMNGKAEDVIKNMQKDPGYALAKNLSENYFNVIAPKYDKMALELEGLQRTYMKAQLELFPDARIFPDANSTLRVTYGKVNGYQPSDAVTYSHVTYLDGVMEKYVPGDYEFDVPQKLIDLYNTKDFGQYADKNGKLPVNFIATNHTTGGNSGSPALDANGNLIGLNFDRVWEGTMSDIHYDPAICRNIMVDSRYILFVIDKYAGAKHLIEEMKIIKPSTNKKTNR
ncbi:S46 family peptidase [Flavobacterium sp. CBA20B-1]|uniref:S46 family peptidase n=1 Tax=unclassified Flavobacterium TaxID=196869 RepID=UPI00222510C7|nr:MULTISPECIES: S46 family peptidase [unclassified Flavobacterium]WCM42558.1 S46 family peptidase [Flavobacterium sp. CBA20B-1]